MFTFYSLGSREMLHKILSVDFITANLGFSLSCSKGGFPETVNNEQASLHERMHWRQRGCSSYLLILGVNVKQRKEVLNPALP